MSYEFPREVLKIVVAQICQGFDFKAIEQSAHDTLTDILAAYIEELGYNAHIAAEHSCRTESNFYDVSYALELMGSDFDKLHLFYKKSDEIPFPRGIPAFPMEAQAPTRGVLRDAIAPHPPHIPSWLPPFPDARTYKSTPLFPHRDMSTKTIKSEREKNRQYMENNLANLHQRSSGLLGNQDIVNYDQVRDVPRTASQIDTANMFLQPRKEIDLEDAAMDVDQPDQPRAAPVPPTIISDVPGTGDAKNRIDKLLEDRAEAARKYHAFEQFRQPPGSPTWPSSPRGGGYNAEAIINMDHTADGIVAMDGSSIPHKISVPNGNAAPPARKP